MAEGVPKFVQITRVKLN